MVRRLGILLVLVSALCSCSDDGPSYPSYSGIASVEVNDTLWIFHFYSYSFCLPLSQLPEGIDNSSRVSFKVRPVEPIVNSDTAVVYRANLIDISPDLRSDILFLSEGTGDSSLASGSAVCVPTDMHITRDFRHNDFFNVTTFYYTTVDNGDQTALVFDPSEQIYPTDSVVVLWLRHSQLRSDSLTHVEYNTFSSPLNVLIPSPESERIRIKVKRLGLENDTIVDDYVYSFRNEL